MRHPLSSRGSVVWGLPTHTVVGVAERLHDQTPQVTVFPVSWQDTGSGVFALASAALALGLGPLRAQPAHRTATYALLAGVAALAVDVYLY